MNNTYIILLVTILLIWVLVRIKDTFNDYNKKPLYLFWHIGALKDRQKRLTEILNRQWNLINNSGLYNEIDSIYIGIVGEEKYPNILLDIINNPKVHIIKNNDTMPSIYECYTTYYLWKFCKDNPDCNTIYIHSRGVTRNLKEMPNCDDWTKMMEYFIIEKWKDNIQSLNKFQTLGCQLLVNYVMTHYSGTFWWARASYINRLPDPYRFSDNSKDRFKCGEMWILRDDKFDINEHKILFHTQPENIYDYNPPKHNPYSDSLPRSIYA